MTLDEAEEILEESSRESWGRPVRPQEQIYSPVPAVNFEVPQESRENASVLSAAASVETVDSPGVPPVSRETDNRLARLS